MQIQGIFKAAQTYRLYVAQVYHMSDFFVDILMYLAYTNSADRDMLYTCITELTFKRHVMSSAAGTAIWRFFSYIGDFNGDNCIFR